MKPFKLRIAIAAAVIGVTSSVTSLLGASVTISTEDGDATFGVNSFPVSNVAIASDPALDAGSVTFQFFTTTASDILWIDAEIVNDGRGFNVPGGWYQNELYLPEPPQRAFLPETSPPPSDLVPEFPALTAAAWLTTPGMTSTAGTNMLIGDIGQRYVLHFDNSDDGLQTDFPFAQVTLIPDEDGNASATLRGLLATLGPDGSTINQRYSFDVSLVPEPGSNVLLLASLIFAGMVCRRRRRITANF